MEKKKKNSFGWIIWVIIFIMISAFSENASSRILVGIFALAVFAVIIYSVIRTIIKAAKNQNIGAQPAHSHDRLSNKNTNFVESIDSFEHYKRQLDGFLSAGIIDKNEYNVLYEKYRKTLK